VSTSSEPWKAMVDWGRTVGWTGGAVAAVEAVPLTCKVAGGPIHVVPMHLAGSAGPATSRSAGPRDEESLGPGDAASPPGVPLPRARAQVLAEPRARLQPGGRPSIRRMGMALRTLGHPFGRWAPSGSRRASTRGGGGHAERRAGREIAGKKEARIEPVILARVELSLGLRSVGGRYWHEPKKLGKGTCTGWSNFIPNIVSFWENGECWRCYNIIKDSGYILRRD
jgi:hypothetical protein